MAPLSSIFGSATGSSTVSTPSKTVPVFGSSASLVKTQGIFGSKPATGALAPGVSGTSSMSGGTFLDLKPPGSTGPTSFSFGSSKSITLPTPRGSITTPSLPSYGIFGQSTSSTAASSSPFSLTAGDKSKSIFGSSETLTKQPAGKSGVIGEGQGNENKSSTSGSPQDGQAKE
uniref:Uncharacterized protein n=1 Tax=Trieres chinensis TaxID=1514140 RepID=A0A7S1Z7A7_TRICV